MQDNGLECESCGKQQPNENLGSHIICRGCYSSDPPALRADLAKAQAKNENLINKIQRVKKFIDFALSEHEKGEHSFELWSALRQAKRIIRETLESEE